MESSATPVSGSSSFLDLPPELRRDIFELAVYLSAASRSDTVHRALRFCTVSKAVHQWLLPIIYETVVLLDGINLQSFKRAALAGRARTTRNLTIISNRAWTNRVEMDTLLMRLPAVRNLQVSYSPIEVLTTASTFSLRSLWITSRCNGAHRAPVLALAQKLQHVTHLCFDFKSEYMVEIGYSWTTRLPALTHVAYIIDLDLPTFGKSVYALMWRGSERIQRILFSVLIRADAQHEVEYVQAVQATLAQAGDRRVYLDTILPRNETFASIWSTIADEEHHDLGSSVWGACALGKIDFWSRGQPVVAE